MTAPVTQRSIQEGWYTVAFVLPVSMTAQGAPEPTNPKSGSAVQPGLVVAARHSGRGSQASFGRHRESVLEAVETKGFTVLGTPRFARFHPPFKPWFLRCNEVIVDVPEDLGSAR